jgi:hypothetical protein
MRGRGGYIGANVTPAAAGVNSAASGVWALREAESLKSAATWPFSPPRGVGSSLQVWLDAADASTIYDATSGGSLVAAGGSVARLADKSGNGRHATQDTQSLRPLRRTAIQAGLDVVRFDGADDSLRAANVFTATTEYTVFFVGRGDAINDNGRAFLSLAPTATSTNGYFHYVYRNDLANKSRAMFTTNGSEQSLSSDTASGITYNAFHCMSAVHSATGREWWINSASQGTANTATGSAAFSSAELRLGWYYARSAGEGFFPLSGDIGEVLVYGSALSDANRSAVESYLMNKWGIS